MMSCTYPPHSPSEKLPVMFLVLIIQAFIALASVVSSLFDSSLTTYSQSTFGLILDIPTVAYFVTSVLESSTVNQTTAVSVVTNESTTDTCAWGIPGLLALRPVALPPSVIDVPSRELQLLNASMHAQSLIQTDSASYTPLGNYSQDSTLLSSSEPILVRHTLKHRSATPSTALRFYFTIGLFLVGMVIMMLTKIFLSERLPVIVVDLVESIVSFLLSFYLS